jgi:hypothetical protein
VAAVRRERERRMLRTERERATLFAGQDPFTGA